MKIQDDVKQSGYRDFKEGVPKHRNPFQYTSDIFKQAAWLTGWNQAKSEESMDGDKK